MCCRFCGQVVDGAVCMMQATMGVFCHFAIVLPLLLTPILNVY